MDQQLQNILKDLYALDADFKVHEDQLKEIIKQVIVSKPDTRFDAGFAARLRSELMSSYRQPQVSPFFSMAKFQYGLLGGVLAMLVIIPITYYSLKGTPSVNTGLTLEQEIKDSGKNSFGEIAFNTTAPQSPAMRGDSVTSVNPAPKAATHMMQPSGAGSVRSGIASAPTSVAPSSPSKMMIYRPEIVTYTYGGEAITIPEGDQKVYKRLKGAESSKALAGILSNLDFDLINLNTFSPLVVRNIELAEDKKNGYSININFDEGIIAVNPNWQRWATPNYDAQLPASAMPSDEKLIAMSNAFLTAKGINAENYGNPVVSPMQYRIYAADAGSTEPSYTPDQVNVVYPLLIHGLEVYEQDGSPYGLQVNVSIRENKVVGIYNLISQHYESAMYEVETDGKVIVDAVTKGPSQNFSYPPEGGEEKVAKRTITLDTPKSILLHYYTYLPNGTNQELFVPALKFPMKENEKVSPQSLVVPIVKSFMSQVKPGDIVPPPNVKTI